ncbi:MAG TPA: CinA family protein [Dissulfurispiraceae bacterium]|nr:CinA family protein [Dissulfurispiraceae bacterium]
MDNSQLIAYCRARHITIAAAESCTGGLVADLLTDVPGASAIFRAGIVAYSREAKETLLGVAGHILQKDGLVSAATARAMADRMRQLSGTDYAMATTGNLGPEGLEDKAVGLVYIAVSSARGVYSRELHLSGDRTLNKRDAALAALAFLYETIEEERHHDEANS